MTYSLTPPINITVDPALTFWMAMAYFAICFIVGLLLVYRRWRSYKRMLYYEHKIMTLLDTVEQESQEYRENLYAEVAKAIGDVLNWRARQMQEDERSQEHSAYMARIARETPPDADVQVINLSSLLHGLDFGDEILDEEDSDNE
jgi:hypothetical protein